MGIKEMDVSSGSKMDILNQIYMRQRKPFFSFLMILLKKLWILHQKEKKGKEIGYNLSLSPSKKSDVKSSPWHIVEAH